MTTPAIMLGLLAIPLLLGSILNRVKGKKVVDGQLAGCVGITLVFCFTGVGHFIKTEPMAEMLPPWVPSRGIPLVYVTGVIELAAAFAVLFPRLRQMIGWLLILMLLGFLPINVYAALAPC